MKTFKFELSNLIYRVFKTFEKYEAILHFFSILFYFQNIEKPQLKKRILNTRAHFTKFLKKSIFVA